MSINNQFRDLGGVPGGDKCVATFMGDIGKMLHVSLL